MTSKYMVVANGDGKNGGWSRMLKVVDGIGKDSGNPYTRLIENAIKVLDERHPLGMMFEVSEDMKPVTAGGGK